MPTPTPPPVATRILEIEADLAKARERQDVNDSGLLAILVASHAPWLIQQLKASQAREAVLRAALAVVAAAKNNEATAHPFWIIVDPRQILKPSISACASLVKGLYFSREAADATIEAYRHRFGKSVGVYCCSGYQSQEYRDLYDAARAALHTTSSEGAPK